MRQASRARCTSGRVRKGRMANTSALRVRWKRSFLPRLCGWHGLAWITRMPSLSSQTFSLVQRAPEVSPQGEPLSMIEGVGETIAAERGRERRLNGRTRLIRAGGQARGKARVIVDHGQRVASRPVDEWQVALEVHLPQQIGSLLLEAVAWNGRRIAARLDPLVPAQDLMHRGRYRRRSPIARQAMRDLAGTPGRVRVAYSDDRASTVEALRLGIRCGRRE